MDQRVAFRHIEMPLTRLFPSGREGSALLVAILVRADEILHLFNAMFAGDLAERKRAEIGDPRPVLNRFIFSRFLMVSLYDGMESLKRFKNLPEIRAQLDRNGDLGKEFVKRVRALGREVERLKPIRDKLGAHLDLDVIQAELATIPDEVHGTMWLPFRDHQHVQYDAAHLVVTRAIVRAVDAAGPDGDDALLLRFQELTKAASSAQVSFAAAARAAVQLFERTAGKVKEAPL